MIIIATAYVTIPLFHSETSELFLQHLTSITIVDIFYYKKDSNGLKRT